jgi:hypothetical protein
MSIHETWQASVNEHLSEPGTFEVYAKLRRSMQTGEFKPITDVVT